MHRAELIEIIYALKQSEDQLKAQNAALTAQLQDRQLRLESAGSIAQAALELNNVFAAAQAAATAAPSGSGARRTVRHRRRPRASGSASSAGHAHQPHCPVRRASR